MCHKLGMTRLWLGCEKSKAKMKIADLCARFFKFLVDRVLSLECFDSHAYTLNLDLLRCSRQRLNGHIAPAQTGYDAEE